MLVMRLISRAAGRQRKRIATAVCSTLCPGMPRGSSSEGSGACPSWSQANRYSPYKAIANTSGKSADAVASARSTEAQRGGVSVDSSAGYEEGAFMKVSSCRLATRESGATFFRIAVEALSNSGDPLERTNGVTSTLRPPGDYKKPDDQRESSLAPKVPLRSNRVAHSSALFFCCLTFCICSAQFVR